MSEQQPDHSRRTFICVIAGSAALLFRTKQACADKMTLREAEYQDTPNGIYSCGMCTFFETPASCKVVEGKVSRDGWCKVFAAVD